MRIPFSGGGDDADATIGVRATIEDLDGIDSLKESIDDARDALDTFRRANDDTNDTLDNTIGEVKDVTGTIEDHESALVNAQHTVDSLNKSYRQLATEIHRTGSGFERIQNRSASNKAMKEIVDGFDDKSQSQSIARALSGMDLGDREVFISRMADEFNTRDSNLLNYLFDESLVGSKQFEDVGPEQTAEFLRAYADQTSVDGGTVDYPETRSVAQTITDDPTFFQTDDIDDATEDVETFTRFADTIRDLDRRGLDVRSFRNVLDAGFVQDIGDSGKSFPNLRATELSRLLGPISPTLADALSTMSSSNPDLTLQRILDSHDEVTASRLGGSRMGQSELPEEELAQMFKDDLTGTISQHRETLRDRASSTGALSSFVAQAEKYIDTHQKDKLRSLLPNDTDVDIDDAFMTENLGPQSPVMQNIRQELSETYGDLFDVLGDTTEMEFREDLEGRDLLDIAEDADNTDEGFHGLLRTARTLSEEQLVEVFDEHVEEMMQASIEEFDDHFIRELNRRDIEQQMRTDPDIRLDRYQRTFVQDLLSEFDEKGVPLTEETARRRIFGELSRTDSDLRQTELLGLDKQIRNGRLSFARSLPATDFFGDLFEPELQARLERAGVASGDRASKIARIARASFAGNMESSGSSIAEILEEPEKLLPLIADDLQNNVDLDDIGELLDETEATIEETLRASQANIDAQSAGLLDREDIDGLPTTETGSESLGESLRRRRDSDGVLFGLDLDGVDFDGLMTKWTRFTSSVADGADLTASQVNEARRGVTQLQDGLQNLIPVLGATSANLGPINLSLANKTKVILGLTSLLGPLISHVLGLASAFVTLGGATAGFLGVGLLSTLDAIEGQMADVENRQEAMEKLVQALQREAIEALAPLRDTEVLGMGPAEAFVSVLREGLRVLNGMARTSSRILENPVVGDSMARIVEALTSDGGGRNLANALTEMSEELAPMVADTLIYFINAIPDLIDFLTRASNAIGDQLGRTLAKFVEVLPILISYGFGFLTVVLYATEAILTLVIAVRDLLTFLGLSSDQIKQLSALIGGVVGAFFLLSTAITAVVGALASYASMQFTLNAILPVLTKYTLGYAVSLGSVSTALSYVVPILIALGQVLAGVATSTAGVIAVFAIVVGLLADITYYAYTGESALGSLIPQIEGVYDVVLGADEAIRSLTGGLVSLVYWISPIIGIWRAFAVVLSKVADLLNYDLSFGSLKSDLRTIYNLVRGITSLMGRQSLLGQLIFGQSQSTSTIDDGTARGPVMSPPNSSNTGTATSTVTVNADAGGLIDQFALETFVQSIVNDILNQSGNQNVG